MLLGEAGNDPGLDGVKSSQFVERTRAVTPQDVQRVASQYLAADMRTTGTLIPLRRKLNRRRRQIQFST